MLRILVTFNISCMIDAWFDKVAPINECMHRCFRFGVNYSDFDRSISILWFPLFLEENNRWLRSSLSLSSQWYILTRFSSVHKTNVYARKLYFRFQEKVCCFKSRNVCKKNRTVKKKSLINCFHTNVLEQSLVSILLQNKILSKLIGVKL